MRKNWVSTPVKIEARSDQSQTRQTSSKIEDSKITEKQDIRDWSRITA